MDGLLQKGSLMRRLKISKKTVWLVSFAGLSLLFFSYNNCSQAILRKAEQVGSLSIPSTQTLLSPPRLHTGPVRVVFFVDQSRSMIAAMCPSDVDGGGPTLKGRGCENPPLGVDPDAIRYKLLDTWLNQLEGKPKTKAAVIAFSGGLKERPRRLQNPNRESFQELEFLEISGPDSAKARAARLRAEHNKDKKTIPRYSGDPSKMSDGETPEVMGTSVPLPTLQIAEDVISKEMEDLKASGELSNTWFRFIYISDFVLRPMRSDYLVMLNLVGCPHACIDSDDSTACVGAAESCMNATDSTRSIWGDYEDNDPAKIGSLLSVINGFPKSKGGGYFTSDFVRLFPQRKITGDLVTRPGDSRPAYFLPLVKAYMPRANYHEVKNNSDVPLSMGQSSNNEAFRLDSAFVINLNGRVGPDGLLVSDSDGDGLSDAEETSTDPFVARTNGVCLDSITEKTGCRLPSTGCNPQFDHDGDGLNECEERSLGTASDLKDTDDDGLIDSMEVILGGRPLSADHLLDDNSDGIDNLTQMRAGVHPAAHFPSVPTSSQVRFTARYLGTQSVVNQAGVPVPTAQYEVKATNIPLMSVNAVNFMTDFFTSMDLNPTSAIPPTHYIGGVSHARGVNQVVFVGKVRSLTDPNVRYWLYRRYDVVGGQSILNIDLSQAFEPHWVGN